MIKQTLTCLSLILFSPTLPAQQQMQDIRGQVTDRASGEPIAYAVIHLESEPAKGAVTDSLGKFLLEDVSLGRHDVKVTCIGYAPCLVREVLVASVKEVFLEIALTENIRELDEVVVRPKVSKGQPLNTMALTGARMFSVEETSRYAGGLDDPARLASSFAGVVTGVSHNGISVHGNAPYLLQWRMEDVEIPNPNHFADVSTLGGGILSSLSSHVLGNSDFFTGAFPAEYGNAVSGVFDMKMRTGNCHRMENTLQVGLLGIDLASEGPISRKHNSSYIVNYRYSMTGLLSHLGMVDLDGTFDFQDLNFKLNFPTRRAGTFSVWGTSLIDKYGSEMEEPEEWKYFDDASESEFDQYMAAGGVTHRYPLGKQSTLKTTMAATYYRSTASMEMLDESLTLTPYLDMKRETTNLVFSTCYNHKASARYMSRSGLTVTGMLFDMSMHAASCVAAPMDAVSVGDGSTTLLSAYTSHSLGLGRCMTLNLGLHGQWLTLNNHYVVEPRLGLKWMMSHRLSLAAAYGLHSRMEKPDVYFTRTPETGGLLVNKELDFTRAHHLMLTLDWHLSDGMVLRIEPYFQSLWNVPVRPDDSYSMLNRLDFYVEDALVNKGKGRNVGVDLTLERYLSSGYYYLCTASLFDSRYRGGDGVWHDTRFNRRYILNLLGGKEWMTGHSRRNLLGIHAKVTLMGGDRYSPVDYKATLAHPDHEVQYDETLAYSQQFSPIVLTNFSISYKMNRRRCTHEVAIKLINATNYKEFGGHGYNIRTGEIEVKRYAMSMPNLYYKMEF